MNLQDLKKEIPYQWRVQSFSKNSAKASAVAYIDARDAMERLDEVCGPENWKDEYYQVKNTLFCKVSIKVNDEWVSKCDGGDETDVEARKGESSDAFKRACVKWGLGRFLYALPIQWVDTDGPKTDAHRYPKVLDATKKPVYNITKFINEKLGKTPNSHAVDTDFTPDVPSITVGAPACPQCNSTNRAAKDGSYGPYWHCNDCGKNESIK